jgi:hypothetical protein
MKNAYTILVRKLKEMRPLGRPRHRWQNNMRLDLRETGCEGIELDSTGTG